MFYVLSSNLLYISAEMALYGGASNVPLGMLFSSSLAGIFGSGGMVVFSRAAVCHLIPF